MREVLIGAFPDSARADEAVDSLQDAGFRPEDISVIMQRKEVARKREMREGRTSVGTGIVEGAAIGGVAGLVLSALGIVVVGPIAGLLGLVGIVGTTVTGAIIGAITGGIATALMNAGVPEREARAYEECIQSGGVVLAVPLESRNEDEVREIFEEFGAENVVVVDMGGRS